MKHERLRIFRQLLRRRPPKVFGIGPIKTGTTSLGSALAMLGYRNTHAGRERLLRCLNKKDYGPIFAAADAHDSFEDWPWPMLYREMDERYPDSRFVLTLRRDPDVWLESVVKHAAVTGPSFGRTLFFGHATPLGHEAAYRDAYRRHIAAVRAYFADRPGKLLEVCWETGSGWAELCGFLGKAIPNRPFPMLNTAENRLVK